MSNTRGAYVGLGLCLGVALGAATHNVGLGAALGILVGSIATWRRRGPRAAVPADQGG